MRTLLSIDKYIQICTDIIEAFEQYNDLQYNKTTLYLQKNGLIKENHKFMKQTTVYSWLNEACKDSADISNGASQSHTPDDPAPQTPGTSDVTSLKTIIPRIDPQYNVT